MWRLRFKNVSHVAVSCLYVLHIFQYVIRSCVVHLGIETVARTTIGIQELYKFPRPDGCTERWTLISHAQVTSYN